jgi:cytochrome b-561 domain-containing protein 2
MLMGDEPDAALDALWPRSSVDFVVVGACAFFGFTAPIALFDSSVLFTYHPTFMSLGFGLFMTLGVGAGLKLRALAPGAERVKALWAHAATQTLALALAIGGFVAIYRNKATHDKPHFTTTHGKLGLLTICLTILSPAIGALAFKKLGALDMLPESIRPLVKAVHRRLGLVTWCCGMLGDVARAAPPGGGLGRADDRVAGERVCDVRRGGVLALHRAEGCERRRVHTARQGLAVVKLKLVLQIQSTTQQ